MRFTLILFAALSACNRMHKEPFEKTPLARGAMEVVKLSETARLNVERIRFFSDAMNEPRFFLTLSPKTPLKPAGVFILNHGWFDRPEDLLKHLHVDQVYNDLLERGDVRPGVVVIPDARIHF